MSILTINSGRSRVIMGTVEYQSRRTLGGAKWDGIFLFRRRLSCKLHGAFGTNVKAFASRHSGKVVNKDRKLRKSETSQNNKNPSIQNDEAKDGSSDNSAELLSSDLATKSSNLNPTRRVVLQACIVTSGFILALGVIIRQVLHIAFMKGWLDQDSTTDVSFDFQMWHLELIIGLVILISSCRYLLLKMWPDFANSSEAANQQVLGSLQPLDFLVVAFLPGISEEMLFRGALLPSFGLNWESALAVGAIFGALHLGSGRRYSFAIWATFVGFAYGFATILSSSLIVPMASHSLNNLIGGIRWRYSSIPEKTRN